MPKQQPAPRLDGTTLPSLRRDDLSWTRPQPKPRPISTRTRHVVAWTRNPVGFSNISRRTYTRAKALRIAKRLESRGVSAYVDAMRITGRF